MIRFIAWLIWMALAIPFQILWFIPLFVHDVLWNSYKYRNSVDRLQNDWNPCAPYDLARRVFDRVWPA